MIDNAGGLENRCEHLLPTGNDLAPSVTPDLNGAISKEGEMKLLPFALFFWVGTCTSMPAQTTHFQEQEIMNHEERIAHLEAERAAMREELKTAAGEIQKLRDSLKDVRQQVTTAGDASKTATEDIGEIKWIGRVIMGAVSFLIGVIVTQWISKFMAARKPRIVRANAG
jgi:hypothetical protein